MSDRFKFKFWDKEICQMRYGDIAIDNEGYPFVLTEHKKLTVIERLDNIIPLQSTGLKDKNGKLIYEGDVVKPLSDFVVGYLGEIKFGKKENYQCFYVDWHTKHPIMRGDLYYWLEDKDEGLEVIGNIYENPELLKECENE
jgi:uncharacterized phage protein (TIGR01671 family)